MVHILAKRFSDRTAPQTEIKVYSNADQVEAKLNGVSLGKMNSPDCRFVWPEITLKPGVNRVQAIAWKAGKPVATDSCGWNYQPAGSEVLPGQFFGGQTNSSASP